MTRSEGGKRTGRKKTDKAEREGRGSGLGRGRDGGSERETED